MKIIKYSFFFFLLILFSCNNEFSKRLDILEIDEKFNNGNLNEAKLDLDKYLKKEPNNEYAWTILGHIESHLDKDILARKAYRKALKINPNTVEAITGMGILARKNGDYEKASEFYYQAIEINPNYAEAYASLVVINLKRKNFDEAVRVGLIGYNLEKEDGTIAANLSTSYHFANDTIQREKYFNIAKNNGYKNLESLRLIFDGELIIFD